MIHDIDADKSIVGTRKKNILLGKNPTEREKTPVM
jgi:hypothetical protein